MYFYLEYQSFCITITTKLFRFNKFFSQIKKHNIHLLALGLLLVGTALSSYSQNSEELETSYKVFDKAIALENTGLSNGVEYLEQHIIRNDQHKYFLSSDFMSGNLQYDGQPYFDISLKYNIYDDILLVLLQNSGGVSNFELHKENVDSFNIKNHDFIRVPSKESSEVQGFHEVLLNLPEVMLLKKHVKKISKHLDRNFTYYEFENDDPQHVIYYRDSYFPINSRRDVQKIFPDHEKQIRIFYRSNRQLRKENPDRFLSQLLQSLNSHL